ncbi:MAG: endonuclease [Saprospiraceae bacterium]
MKKVISGFLFLIILFYQPVNLFSQFDNENIFPESSGDELFEKLVENYKTSTVLDYSQCRDTLYKNIYRINDTVHCVYTNFGVFLPDGVDPSTYIYNNGTAEGINAEHTYPVSMGAETGFAKSDMHHIFPTKVNVNSDRGSLPFNEVNDNLTENWYYKDTEIHYIPSSNKDSYSELGQGYFEPREDHKGNVARAMFYIKTMYRDQTDATDPNFFDSQKDTLCAWHFRDPVDSLEWTRTWQIAKYQDNKPNPFVLDCSLASRTFCDFISNQCTTVSTFEVFNEQNIQSKLFPNPSNSILNISFINPDFNYSTITIYNILGNVEMQQEIPLNYETIAELKLDINSLIPGVYILNIHSIENNKLLNINKRFIKL